MLRKSTLSVLFGLSLLLSSTAAVTALTHPAISQEAESGQAIDAQPGAEQRRPRIAILDFDFSPSAGGGTAIYTEEGIVPQGYITRAAQGVSEILTDRLVRDGAYVVIERNRVDSLLSEQDMGDSGRIDSGTAAQLGRILGVDAVIFGTITKFDASTSSRGRNILGFGNRRTVVEAAVQLNTRMVSTSTGEILTTAQGNGSADESSGGVQFGGIFGESNDEYNVGELLSVATDQAIQEVLEQINAVSSSLAALPPALPATSATIADVSGSTIVLNRGDADGYRTGMCLSVEKLVREVTDPETGEVIHRVTESTGQIRLDSVNSSSSVGELTAGTAASLTVGDVAQPINCGT